MKRILIVSGHPDLNDSFANKTILEELSKLLPHAEFVYLDKLYPDFKIDVMAEQERLLRADIIVFQFPLFWRTVTAAQMGGADFCSWLFTRAYRR